MADKKRGRKPNDTPSDPLDAFAPTKVRQRWIKKAKQICAHRGIDIQDYLDAIIGPSVDRDFKAMVRELADEA